MGVIKDSDKDQDKEGLLKKQEDRGRQTERRIQTHKTTKKTDTDKDSDRDRDRDRAETTQGQMFRKQSTRPPTSFFPSPPLPYRIPYRILVASERHLHLRLSNCEGSVKERGGAGGRGAEGRGRATHGGCQGWRKRSKDGRRASRR